MPLAETKFCPKHVASGLILEKRNYVVVLYKDRIKEILQDIGSDILPVVVVM